MLILASETPQHNNDKVVGAKNSNVAVFLRQTKYNPMGGAHDSRWFVTLRHSKVQIPCQYTNQGFFFRAV